MWTQVRMFGVSSLFSCQRSFIGGFFLFMECLRYWIADSALTFARRAEQQFQRVIHVFFLISKCLHTKHHENIRIFNKYQNASDQKVLCSYSEENCLMWCYISAGCCNVLQNLNAKLSNNKNKINPTIR